jgi:acetyl esterase/lipase
MDATPDGTTLLDPGLLEMLGAFSLPDISSPEILAGIRGQITETIKPLGSTEAVERTDHLVPGDHPVPVRVHRPRGVEGPLPCVYAIHGGGMILGTYDMDDSTFEAWCQELGVMGVSVEYRLAPEFPYPTPLDDCERGLLWAVEHAEELGIDTDRLGVFGISAGAGLSAGLALRVRDNGGPTLAFQLLETPMLDDRQVTTSSTTDGLIVWSNPSNRFGWSSYLGDLYGGDVPAEAAPARAVDLSGLPPTFISVGTADGFRDEAIDYAQRLAVAGVPVELHMYPGLPHGFQAYVDHELVQSAARDRRDWLRRQTRPS